MAARYRRLETWIWQTPTQTVPLGGVLWLRAPKGAVVELSLDSIFVILSSSVSAEDHTIKYAVGSEPIRRDCLQLTISMEKLQLMMPIYFSGVPVLHGSPRQHIWIFAAGGREMFLVSITVRVTLLLTHCTSHHLWEGLLLWAWDCVPWCPVISTVAHY